MTAAATVPVATEPRLLEEAVARLADSARIWARASYPERIALARSMLRGVERTAERSVAASCAAKGIRLDTPPAGEEWLSGPWAVIRQLRLVTRSLEALAKKGDTPVGKLAITPEGQLTARAFPVSTLDAALFMGVRADVHFEEGATARELVEARARFYKAPDHDGKVCLVLGAGNINSIPQTDVATKLFNEGKVCLLKMNPVNAYLGPFIEEAFQEAIARGFLAVVYGGGDVGAYLTHHPGVHEIHITGSNDTHDLIVWGPPGPERAARMARNEPVVTKEVTSELGNVTPVIVVPGPWDPASLRFQAESVAGMVTHNASFNCISGKVLVLPRGWKHSAAFLDAIDETMRRVPARQAWYPGAADRWRRLTGGGELRSAAPADGTLPWTLIRGLDPGSRDPAFTTEAFCAILAETSVGSEDPQELLSAAVDFANEKLWGTLAAHLVVHPATLRDRTLAAATRAAIRALRYGTVSVNVWAGYPFAFGSTPWGAYPGAPLTDVQSGRGLVHNTLMLDRVEKTVAHHPTTTFPKPPYFPTHRTAHRLAKKLVALEAHPGRLSLLPGILADAVRS